MYRVNGMLEMAHKGQWHRATVKLFVERRLGYLNDQALLQRIVE